MKGLLRTSALMSKECTTLGRQAAASKYGGGGAKWYVASYEWFAQEAMSALSKVPGVEASTDLNNEDVFLQLTSYRDVAWDPVLKMTSGSCHLHMRRGTQIIQSPYILAIQSKYTRALTFEIFWQHFSAASIYT